MLGALREKSIQRKKNKNKKKKNNEQNRQRDRAKDTENTQKRRNKHFLISFFGLFYDLYRIYIYTFLWLFSLFRCTKSDK